MLTQELTPALYQTWRSTWAAHRDRLRPNRISGPALDRYLRHAYPLAPLTDPSALRIVTENVAHNAPWASKLPPGVPPQPVAYWVRDTGAGAALYRAGDLAFEAIFMTDDGSVWITPGLAGQYQSDRPYQVLQP